MITGSIKYVVVQADDEDTILAIWGPFPTREEAMAWPGIVGHEGSYTPREMRSAPQWFKGMTTDGEE